MEHRLVVLGPGGTGKSAMTIRWVSNHFVEDYDPGIEDSYRKQISYQNQSCLLEILDTGGREAMALSVKLGWGWGKNLRCAVFVYDIASMNSFHECLKLLEELRAIPEQAKLPCVWIGNKLDLQEKRDVPFTEAKALLASSGITDVIEVSCKDRINIDESLQLTLTTIFKNLPLTPPVKPKKSSGCTTV